MIHRHLTLSTLLVLALFSAPAHAGESADQIRDRIEQSVARNACADADRAYLALLGTGARATYRDHLLAGQAARALGDVNAALARFERARRAEDTSEISEQIERIQDRYGQVKLKVPGKHSGGVALSPRSPVIDAELRAVIEHARRTLAQDGRYKGLLPVGGYRLGRTDLEVSNQVTTRATLR